MTIKRIHVLKQRIQSNAKHGRDDPPIAVRTYSGPNVKTPKSTDYAHGVFIDGPSQVIYKPEEPLKCGAKLWIETEASVEIDLGPCTMETLVPTKSFESPAMLAASREAFAKQALLREALRPKRKSMKQR